MIIGFCHWCFLKQFVLRRRLIEFQDCHIYIYIYIKTIALASNFFFGVLLLFVEKSYALKGKNIFSRFILPSSSGLRYCATLSWNSS